MGLTPTSLSEEEGWWWQLCSPGSVWALHPQEVPQVWADAGAFALSSPYASLCRYRRSPALSRANPNTHLIESPLMKTWSNLSHEVNPAPLPAWQYCSWKTIFLYWGHALIRLNYSALDYIH